ncbi:tetratricopeptide repeat protein [Vibrio viridaestus]|uniref:ATP-dependent transcriptional regulator n=1 Tax=Vibrio viridaestus TaxID=2487322 RepID=A0A3N9U5E7_9VIBR|nr:hypothetical protein [Vibrio viridaestus]RQW64922.1 hypothetical protein EES38_02475 [Vibrio viridaestus]
MDRSRYLLEIEIEQLKRRIEGDPEDVLTILEQCLARSKQIDFPQASLECLILMSRCSWHLKKPKMGLKFAKDALQFQNRLDHDDFLPIILELHGLHFFEEGKLFTAQQYWINALEQAALEDNVEVEIECLLGLGDIWRETQEFQLACSTHQLAVQVANSARINDLEGKARVLWAWDLYLLKDYVEMLEVLDAAQSIFESEHDTKYLAEVWDFRALALLGLERLKDAEEATQTAHELAVEHNLGWVKIHSSISHARLELLRGDLDKANELLSQAELSVDVMENSNAELLTQIYYQQSKIAEQKDQFDLALNAFKKYRHYSIEQIKHQKALESSDKARGAKKQLEQRARKLINRVRGQYEYNPEKHLSNVVSETYWWEQLVLFKTELKHANHTVLVIYHPNPKYIDICTELTHSLCTSKDLVSRLSSERLGILIDEKDAEASELHRVIIAMIGLYPWERQGLSGPLPKVDLHDILTFPFTLEQLELLSTSGRH